ncbi:Uncharacterised protein [Halioglobus japonicus]|nr:Uncharacterised protein [Halioglobus japonicus]
MYYPEHQVAFVAINKTGSSSVLTALNEALYNRDVPELWQKKPFHKRQRVREDLKHAQAYFYYHVLGEETYSKCYVFSQVRNPFDKVVSDFIFRCRAPKKDVETWRQQRPWFVRQGLLEPTSTPEKNLFRLYVGALASGEQSPHPHWGDISANYDMPDAHKPFINQVDGLTDLDGKIMVDEIFKLEDMPEDWRRLQHTISAKAGRQVADLPHINKSDRDKYKKYYDDETYRIVSELFKDDIAFFDYAF